MFNCIHDRELRELLIEKFKQPCEDAFIYLARYYPNCMIVLLESNELKDTDLTFAAEWAGNLITGTEVLGALAKLTIHDSDLVAEGAVLGIRAWAYNATSDPRKIKCLRCDWKGTVDEAGFGTSCGDGCCSDWHCPKCESAVADEDYQGG